MLKSDRLIEESWILLRVLLETHINLIYFLKNDGTEMTRRWADAAMLDKLKYLKEVSFFEEAAHEDLLSSRRETLESTQNMLLGRLAFLLSELVNDSLITGDLLLLGLGYEKYRDKKDGQSTTESETDPGTFYVWRV
jgi:hypothetical protein